MKKDIIRVYECKKCKCNKMTTNGVLDNLICKICGGELCFSYSYEHNSNNGMRAIKNSNAKNKFISQSNNLQSTSQILCPYCQSTNISKIGTLNRVVSVGMFGLASKKIGKQWHCNNCKSDF